ncbi:hypothetical protein F5Y08DRAFT_338194 [Xylaria arbuscula]|nr:hypothetical protein F5Y08DRAFT_338194 [Xylaria arbuscula]
MHLNDTDLSRFCQDKHDKIDNMHFQTYFSVLIAIVGAVSSAPIAEGTDAIQAVKKSMDGRFKPVWVIGFDEEQKEGNHIGFRLYREGDEPESTKAHGDHSKASGDHESSFWYYY